MPLSNPYAFAQSYVDWKFGEPLLIEGGDPFDYSTGREIDGLPVSEAEFQRRLGNGSVVLGKADRQGNTYVAGAIVNFGSSIWIDDWYLTYSVSGTEFPLVDAGNGTASMVNGPSVTINASNAGYFVTPSVGLKLTNSLIPRATLPQEPSKPSHDKGSQIVSNQGRLPFNSCREFVNYLVAYATQALGTVVESRTVNNHPQVAMAVGTEMMTTAYFGYESHIHNRFDGFKPALTNAGESTPSGRQGAGVYGHIFFAGGSWIFAKGNPIGYAAYAANKGKDWLQAATGKFGGGDQYASERAGNIAGRAVGAHMWNFISGATPRDPQRLKNSLMNELCE